MKLTEYQDKLKEDREYQEAYQELEYQFLFGNAVLRARLNKGLTQKQLAKQVGTKQANISRIESGLGNPTLDLIHRLCKALEIQIGFTNGKKPCAEIIFSEVTDSMSNSIPVGNWPMRNTFEQPKTSTTFMINERST